MARFRTNGQLHEECCRTRSRVTRATKGDDGEETQPPEFPGQPIALALGICSEVSPFCLFVSIDPLGYFCDGPFPRLGLFAVPELA